MAERFRWERCILQRGREVSDFFGTWLKAQNRRVLLIAGAGFDPRAKRFPELLAGCTGTEITALFLKEERPHPDAELVTRSEDNLKGLRAAFPKASIVPVHVFTADNAVVIGRNAMSAIRTARLDEFTDICIDCSALSRGVVFPIVRFILASTQTRKTNVHVLVADEPNTDALIVPVSWERADYMLGFRGRSLAAETIPPARLWLPHLAPKQRAALDLIHKAVDPNDTCPILPFPARNPKEPDLLIEEYANQLENTWQVDPRNVLYADEANPLDLYRSILRLDSARERVFRGSRPSQLILSPLGSKLLSIGSLMAAIERDFPVMYVEAIEYKVSFGPIAQDSGSLVHIWLQGDAYELGEAQQKDENAQA